MFKSACVGVLLAASIVSLSGCGAPAEEDSDGAAGAASADTSHDFQFQNATYGDLQVVVHEGEIRGRYFTALGDPAHGGATCSFTFAGRIDEADNGHEAAVISLTDGYDTAQGTIRVDKKGNSAGPELELDLGESVNSLGACSRMISGPLKLDDAKKLTDAGTVGWAAVSADKTFFFDKPNGAKRNAFVLKGDLVALKAQTGGDVVKDGFVQVEFVNDKGQKTAGFLSFADLAAPWTRE